MGRNVHRILHRDGVITAAETKDGAGRMQLFQAEQFIVSMPLKETVLAFDPPLAAEVVAAALRLSYRDFITVALVVTGENPFPDNWIYIHEPEVKLGRIQNFKNWSEAMIGEPGTTCLGLEYFCFEGDGLWSMTDDDLVALGKRELAKLGLAKPENIKDGAVVRVEKAYPVYDPGYQANVDIIRAALTPFANLQPVGRNGLHKYNNQDHSMMTAILAVKNLRGAKFNLWQVNSDAEYHEEVRSSEDTSGRLVPRQLSAKPGA
jgi:protoporphyrinogen oxidase